jgi:hypothetical protein
MENKIMAQEIAHFIRNQCKKAAGFAAVALVLLPLAGSFTPLFAQQPGEQAFASPQDAARALVAAMTAPDGRPSLQVLGPAAKEVLSSGDPIEDSDARAGFVAKYQEMHRFVKEADGSLTLVVGAENWPFPIPLANNHGSWYFDTDAGKDEILFRRIGGNELAAEDACQDLVAAQKEYFAHPVGGRPNQFAQKLVSTEGRHDGLYWHGAYDEFDSPINSLIAYAYGPSSTREDNDTVPYNGYFFRILTKQGPHATGGAKNYIVDGAMTGGFAFVAYPAEYRSSGVMTFVVDESGVIYQKDLGSNTGKIAAAMTSYDPDSTWHQAE